MTGFFKVNNPFNPFVLMVYGLLLKLSIFLYPAVPVLQPGDGFLYKALLSFLAPVGERAPVIYSIITFILLYTQAINLNKMVNKQRLLQKPTYLIAMSYLLLTSLLPGWDVFSAPLFVNTALIWIWSQLCELGVKQNVKTTLFNVGTVVGICSFLYFPAIAFMLLMLFGLIITRPFRLSEWLIALLGVLTPYYFYWAAIFLTGQWPTNIFSNTLFSYSKWNASMQTYPAIISMVLIIMLGIFFVQKNYRKQLIQTRKSWNIIVLYGIIALLISFANSNNDGSSWVLCAVPLSIITAAAFFYPSKKWMPNLLHWLMIAYIVAINYYIK